MQIKYISSFLTLYREQNISKAAAKLYMTQQGLSRQIQALESELDVVLFERSKQGAQPTTLCHKLYPLLLNMSEEYARVVSLIEEEKKRSRKCITVAFAQGISNGGSAEFIFNYQKLHPEINIEILESTQAACIQKLLDQQLDVAFLVTPIEKTLFNVIELGEGYMYAALHKTHPLAADRQPIDFSCLDGENIITGAPQNALRGVFDHFCRLTNIRAHIVVSSNYSLNYVNAMTENTGIATVTAKMAQQITNPDIVVRRLLTPEPGVVYCCTPRNMPVRREVSAMLGYVRRCFERTPVFKLDESLQTDIR